MQIPEIPELGAFRFQTKRSTRWSDEDTQGVVNNAVYMTLLEEARFDYFSSLGLVEDNAFPFVLMQTNIRFLSPLRGGQKVTVALRTLEMGNSSIRQVSRILSVDSGQVLVEAEVLLVSWSNEDRCKVPIAGEFRDRVSLFEGLGKE
ncbi:MAG: YbgC/YbaW family acyl-CoA thioester hydrolase [Planctomycetota bacterium]|jgi:YbgC/YbaW family acyl-CoA thioester hydrolase